MNKTKIIIAFVMLSLSVFGVSSAIIRGQVPSDYVYIYRTNLGVKDSANAKNLSVILEVQVQNKITKASTTQKFRLKADEIKDLNLGAKTIADIAKDYALQLRLENDINRSKNRTKIQDNSGWKKLDAPTIDSLYKTNYGL